MQLLIIHGAVELKNSPTSHLIKFCSFLLYYDINKLILNHNNFPNGFIANKFLNPLVRKGQFFDGIFVCIHINMEPAS